MARSKCNPGTRNNSFPRWPATAPFRSTRARRLQLDTAEDSGGDPTIDFNGSGGQLTLWPEALASQTLASTVDGFAAGDMIDVDGVSDASVAFSVDGNGNLVATVGGMDQLTFAGTALDGNLTATPDNAGASSSRQWLVSAPARGFARPPARSRSSIFAPETASLPCLEGNVRSNGSATAR